MTEGGALGAFKPIPNSSKAPCQVQRAIAAHNSVYDTLRTKKETVHKAPCDVPGQGAPSQKVAANG